MGAVSPGNSSDNPAKLAYIMGNIRFVIVLLMLAGCATAKDIFRYVDEDTGSTHYMTGEAGKAVEGGFSFTADDSEYILTYKADENGFVPAADHLPVAVVETRVPPEDTNEVAEAKANFYALYKEAKMRTEEAIAEAAASKDEVVDIKKRSAGHHKMAAPHGKYTFHPYFGYVPADAKVGEDEAQQHQALEEMMAKKYHFVPYKGFVATDVVPEGKPEFKFVPYRGFVPVCKECKAAEEEAEARLYNFHPYYGYIPTAADADDEEVASRPQFKFHPWHGFVPVDQDAKVETPEDKVFKYVPYRGFVPVQEDEDAEPAEDHPHPYFKKLANMRYKFVPFQGFVPHVMEEEEAVEAIRKRRETNDNEDVAKKLTYKFHPYFGLVPEHAEVKSVEDQEYKYVPYFGFVPLTEDAAEDVPTYKFNPFYGFVEAKGPDASAEEAKDTMYKFVPYYGFVPVNKMAEAEEAADETGKLVFHPYYGYMPRLVTDKKVPEPLYKLDPVHGFVPVAKDDEVEATRRKKRDAQVLFAYHPYQSYYQVPYYHHVPYYYDPYAYSVPTFVQVLPANNDDDELALPEEEFPVIPDEEGQNEPGAESF